ncbi:winged helix-turn-helix domain-containing protein [Rheinheimera sp. EpRS3]|uniref:winged helix-turn-helix domain-containing protein n=1 Tax=Rheinheimera sp. EpRS3 TaxID=1712383 RepID=UPI000747FC1C|nr:winged helix-turn-helix domain-containing protein [Rheinheimera sp. EpRS3]KUM52177.1 hypothetical protein AR688_02400 [Rheinheimera sp. EpRS3]
MKIVDLGEFRVDTQERRLYRQHEELAAEPKVIEVLCYFILHADRFVSLQELHQQVWQGRVVTDTAVRRTVSKLRALLGDNDTEQPKYIRSQMKRGYQLVCPAFESQAQPADKVTLQPDAATSNEEYGSVKRPNYRRIVASGIFFASLLSICWLYLQPAQGLQADLQQVILDIPGQKASLAVSADGRYQAFVGRVNSSDNWQLFLHDKATAQLTKISTPVPHVRFVDFVAGDTLLAYVGFRADHAEFYLQPLSNLAAAPQRVVLPDLPILAGPLALPDNRLLIAGGETYNGNIHYYQYDLTQKTISQFSYSSIVGVQDAYARLSPDRSQVALVRANIAERKLYLQLYRLADKELLYERLLSNELADTRIAWISNAELLIKRGDSFEQLHLADNKLSALDNAAHSVKELVLDGHGRYFAIFRKAAEQQIYKTRWPFREGFNQHLQLGPQVLALHFSQDPQYYWLVEQQDKQYLLSRYYPATAQRQLVMQSEASFTLLDQAPASALLLLKRNNRLELLDVNSGMSANISLRTQQVDQGVFAADGSAVYFPVFSAGQWQIMQYEVASASQHLLLQDYRYLQPYKDGYLGADSTGRLWQLDKQFGQQQLLYQGIHFDLDYKFMLRQEQLSLVHRTLMSDWQLVRIDLQQHTNWQRSLAFNEFSLNFSLDVSGNELLFFKPRVDTNQLVSGGYNFGYKSIL